MLNFHDFELIKKNDGTTAKFVSRKHTWRGQLHIFQELCITAIETRFTPKSLQHSTIHWRVRPGSPQTTTDKGSFWCQTPSPMNLFQGDEVNCLFTRLLSSPIARCLGTMGFSNSNVAALQLVWVENSCNWVIRWWWIQPFVTIGTRPKRFRENQELLSLAVTRRWSSFDDKKPT